MDLLTIPASVAGLLSVVENISSILATIAPQTRQPPRLIESVTAAVKDFEITIYSLPHLLSMCVHDQTRRLGLIQLDHLMITLTEAVLTLSDLDSVITPFASSREVSVWNDRQWVQKESTVLRIIEQLRRQNSALSSMLNIVHW